MKRHILVVDDEPGICEMIIALLKSMYYDVDEAHDFDAAKELIDSKEYDIVLTDKNLPGIEGNNEGGLDVLRYLKSKQPATEVIMMTGYASLESALAAIKLGAFDYITKPFKLEEMRNKVDRLLEYKSSINPESILPIYKSFKQDLTEVVSNIDHLSQEEKESVIDSFTGKADLFFNALKAREKAVFMQREALASITKTVSQLKDQLDPDSPLHVLADRIFEESTKRI